MAERRIRFLIAGLALGFLTGAPAGAFDALDPEAALRPGLAWQPTAILRPVEAQPSTGLRSLERSAFFRFLNSLPLEPISIGPAPRLPYEREPVVGLVLVVSLD